MNIKQNSFEITVLICIPYFSFLKKTFEANVSALSNFHCLPPPRILYHKATGNKTIKQHSQVDKPQQSPPTFCRRQSPRDATCFLGCSSPSEEFLSTPKKCTKPLGKNTAALVFHAEAVITDLFTFTVEHDSVGGKRCEY